MKLLKFVRLLVVLVLMVSGEHMTSEENRELAFKNIHRLGKDPNLGQVICARLSKEPYFEAKMLLGNPWRTYYSWNTDVHNLCTDLTFTNATLAMITRTYNDMNEYLETQPHWDAATLMIRMGPSRLEILLFADKGPAGRFQGVPNVIRDGSMYPEKRTVPLLSFFLKLINEGKYLLMADCQVGVTTLFTRKNEFPFQAQIAGIISNLDFGSGHHICRDSGSTP